MPRVYGYMENGQFVPTSQSSGSNAQNGIGQFTNEQWALLQDILNERSRRNVNAVQGMSGTHYASNNYGVPYSNAPAYGQRFYSPGYAPINVAVGFNNGPRVRYNYQPRYTGNGYAPRGYNTNMNYGPWYGQQSYATYPPYAPNQPRYEWVPGSNGQPVAVRLGEYQREQPVAYETMFNSQGVPVRVPVYAPMNNSAMPVRMGTDIEGNPLAGNTQQRQQQRRQVQQRVVSTSALGKDGYVDQVSAGLVNVDNPGNLGHLAIYNADGTGENSATSVVSNPSSLSTTGYDLAIDLFGKTREQMIQEEFDRIKQQPLVGDISPLTDDQILANVTRTIDNKINRQLKRVNNNEQAQDNQLFVSE